MSESGKRAGEDGVRGGGQNELSNGCEAEPGKETDDGVKNARCRDNPEAAPGLLRRLFGARTGASSEAPIEAAGQEEASSRRRLFFHEDDYGMLELIPADRLPSAAAELDKIAKFADDHRSESGYTDLYVRQDDPEGLSRLELRLTDIEAAVSKFAEPFDIVTTGYGSGYRVECPDIQAFGPNEETVLFCQHQGGLVTRAWLTLEIGEEDQRDWGLRILTMLGRLAPLALVDWLADDYADLRDEASIVRYLDGLLEN
ncbi:hypothetical protein QWJ34_16765 [Saccharibacillus sp. CPCC 101409]|uniref:hypothetical protein n=1 Tax=Saccharibacillus sp. CPCC 101409 TaxID=3058041 RepID=UPI00267204D1|nr:hypothetical protein [Saccharibacillus sp. CPCC 101409]MDO3411420.1 hypothetical protein [Saccharibacillus sp. CPCC 101409]